MLGTAAALLFGACANDPDTINKLADDEELKPLNIQYDVVYNYSDSATQRLELKAPVVLDFSQLDEPYYEFKEGIDVTFFDKFGHQENYLRANYAKQLLDKDIWEARGDVVVNNKKGEKLSTEELFWNMKTEKIYSSVFVKITTGDETIMGVGFEADQNFTSYTIKSSVAGEMELEDNKDE